MVQAELCDWLWLLYVIKGSVGVFFAVCVTKHCFHVSFCVGLSNLHPWTNYQKDAGTSFEKHGHLRIFFYL